MAEEKNDSTREKPVYINSINPENVHELKSGKGVRVGVPFDESESGWATLYAGKAFDDQFNPGKMSVALNPERKYAVDMKLAADMAMSFGDEIIKSNPVKGSEDLVWARRLMEPADIKEHVNAGKEIFAQVAHMHAGLDWSVADAIDRSTEAEAGNQSSALDDLDVPDAGLDAQSSANKSKRVFVGNLNPNQIEDAPWGRGDKIAHVPFDVGDSGFAQVTVKGFAHMPDKRHEGKDMIMLDANRSYSVSALVKDDDIASIKDEVKSAKPADTLPGYSYVRMSLSGADIASRSLESYRDFVASHRREHPLDDVFEAPDDGDRGDDEGGGPAAAVEMDEPAVEREAEPVIDFESKNVQESKTETSLDEEPDVDFESLFSEPAIEVENEFDSNGLSLEYTSPYSGKAEQLHLDFGTYVESDMCMSVQAFDDEGAPYSVVTVNLGNDIGNDSYMQYGCAFLDENNMPGVGKALEDAGLAKPYTRFGEPVMGYSGYCEYPLYQFDMDKVEKAYPEWTETYKAGYSAELARNQKEWMREMGFSEEAISEEFGETDVSPSKDENEVLTVPELGFDTSDVSASMSTVDKGYGE